MRVTLLQIRYMIYIRDSLEERQYAPSIREIAEWEGGKNMNAVKNVLDALRAKGLVDWEPGESRTVHLTDEGWEFLDMQDEE